MSTFPKYPALTYSALLVAIAIGLTSCLEFKNVRVLPEDNMAISIKPSFSSLKSSLIDRSCTSCHSGSNPPHGINLTSYDKIMNSAVFPPLVVPGNPEASSLYQVVANGSMPKNAASWSPKSIKALYDWIKNGAKADESDPTPIPSPHPTEPGGDDGVSGNMTPSTEPCDQNKLENEPGIVKCL